MIKDIFKGAFRSFSRTIGRILAYVALGFLLSLILGKCDVFAATSKTFAIGFNGNTTLFTTSNQSDPYSGYYSISNGITRIEYKNSSVELKKDYYVNASMKFKLDFVSLSLDGTDLSVPSGNIKLTHSVWLYNSSGEKRLSDDFCSFTYNQHSKGYPDDMSYHYVLEGFFDCQSFKVTETGYLELVTHISGLPNSGVSYSYLDLKFFDYNITTNVDQDALNQAVINNQNQNTNKVINNQNQNTQDIINNQNKNNQEIIDNQNKNSQETQDTINDNFQECRDSRNLFNEQWNQKIVPSVNTGLDVSLKRGASSDYIEVDSSKNYFITYTPKNDSFLMFYDKDKEYLGYSYIDHSNQPFMFSNFSLFSKTKYIRLRVDEYSSDFKTMVNEGNSSLSYEKNGEKICKNRIDETNDKLEEAEKTRKGILQTIIDLPKNIISGFLDLLLGLFIPKDFDFLNGFLDALENKLGFIASIPIQLIEFLIDLPNYAFKEVTSITLPKIEILGVSWWDSQEIDFTEILDVIKPFRYFTDLTAIILFINGLMKYYDGFANGG